MATAATGKMTAAERRAEITQADVFRLFGSKKNLFIQVVTAAFDQLVERISAAGWIGVGVIGLALVIAAASRARPVRL